MESHAVHHRLVALAAVFLLAVATSPARAQAELTGSWAPLGTEDVSNDSVPVDYMGLPLTEEARVRALTYSESQLGMVEHQCEAWPATYLITGPFGLKITAETEPLKDNVVSYTIGAWSDRLPLVIWMDGRPHPSAKYGEHTRTGFTTGRWEGNTLVAVTTHMKAGNLRKTGPPLSDEATMTTRFYRHGDILTVLAVIENPVYLTEPVIWSKSYQLSSVQMAPLALACITTFEGTTPGTVPHFDPDKNPFVDEMTKKFGVPRDAVMGRPETLYPEYRQKIKQ
jgi:hypothetical protein